MATEIVRELVNGVWRTVTSRGGGGGGSQPGAAIVRKFGPFAYNDAGLKDGIVFYTPTVGDYVLNGWAEIDTEWDGTTPLGDFGPPGIAGRGLVSYAAGTALDMTNSWYDGLGNGDVLNPALNVQVLAFYSVSAGPLVPFKIAVATPWKFWVTQDGVIGSDAPGATKGAAFVYVVTATPA